MYKSRVLFKYAIIKGILQTLQRKMSADAAEYTRWPAETWSESNMRAESACRTEDLVVKSKDLTCKLFQVKMIYDSVTKSHTKLVICDAVNEKSVI